jgi:cation transport ATPase
VTVGEPVVAGTINETAALEVRVMAIASDSTLARIIHAVEHAQANARAYAALRRSLRGDLHTGGVRHRARNFKVKV